MQNTQQALFTEKPSKEIVNLVSELNASQLQCLSNHLASLTNVEILKVQYKAKPQRIVVRRRNNHAHND